jgi:hypothetical protein
VGWWWVDVWVVARPRVREVSGSIKTARRSLKLYNVLFDRVVSFAGYSCRLRGSRLSLGTFSMSR